MLRPVLVTAPTPLSIITLADAKAWCRVSHVDEDALITGLINAAESRLDGYSGILGRALAPQTWSQSFCAFEDRLSLSVGIAQSITSITYYDASNVLLTLNASVYQLLTDALGSYVALNSAKSWPSIYIRPDAVKLTWVAGYATAADVPAAIITAMRMMITQWYDAREGTDEISATAMALLTPFRRVSM
jgi:uncharacterized phiE125 gp8 family phage protein